MDKSEPQTTAQAIAVAAGKGKALQHAHRTKQLQSDSSSTSEGGADDRSQGAACQQPRKSPKHAPNQYGVPSPSPLSPHASAAVAAAATAAPSPSPAAVVAETAQRPHSTSRKSPEVTNAVVVDTQQRLDKEKSRGDSAERKGKGGHDQSGRQRLRTSQVR